jgi:hypothetical protein
MSEKKPRRPSSREIRNPDMCNPHVIAATIAATGESKAVIEHVIAFQLKFIADKIEEGSFESVRVPKFGVFRAKLKSVQWRSYMAAMPDNYRKLIRGR